MPDSDENRRRLNATGQYVAQNPRAARENVGFHWNALATMSWVALLGDRRSTFVHKARGTGKSVQRFYSPRRRVVISRGRSCTCNVHYWSNLNIKDSLARLRRNQDPDQGVTESARPASDKCPMMCPKNTSPKWKARSAPRKRQMDLGTNRQPPQSLLRL